MNLFKNLRIGAKIVAGYIILILLLIGTSALLLFSLNNLTDSFTFLVEHDQKVLANAAKLEKLVVDMETGERGFLITGHDEFLEPYDNGIAEFDVLLKDQKDLVSDNPSQVDALEEIGALHNEWIRVAAEPEIAKRREANQATVNADQLQELLKAGVGKGILDELRGVLDDMEASFRADDDLASVILTIKIAKDMVDQETGQRGFIITGEDSFLDPFRSGQAQLAKDIAALRRRLAGDSVNLARLDQAESLAANWLLQAGQPEIDARLEMNANPVTMADVTAMIEAGAGKSVLDNMRSKFNAFTQTENELNVQRSEQANQNAVLTRYLTIGLMLGSIVIGLAVGIAISRAITNPIQVVTRAAARLAEQDLPQLVRAIQAVAEGDLTATFQLRPNLVEIRSHDEVGQMAQAFNSMNEALGLVGNSFAQMLVNLHKLVGQVQQSADQVANASLQLNNSAEQAGQAGQQVAATSQQVSLGATQQARSIDEATNNVERTARAAEGIARGAQEQAQAVQTTSDSITEMANIVGQVGQITSSVTEANASVTQAASHGVTAVAQTSQGMETIRSRTDAAAKRVKEMGARSKEIGRIVETIDTIADKTDMLALNAAVEAARAGEYGRGFAVVADQVRKLSEDSKEATRDIDDLIERVQVTIDEAVTAMEHTVTEVDRGAQLAGETTQSLQEIMQAAEGAANLAGQINGAVAQLKQKSEGIVTAIDSVGAVAKENTSVAEEMAAGSQETTTAMENVASIVEENTASIEEVSASAEEMSAQVEEVVVSSEDLSALAEELRAAAGQFQMAERENGQIEASQPENLAPVEVDRLTPVEVDRRPTPAPAAARQDNGYGDLVPVDTDFAE